MDKFDESIKDAQTTYQPSKDFVDTTMSRLADTQPSRARSSKKWYGVVAAALALIALVIGIGVYRHHSTGPVAVVTGGTSATPTTTTTQPPAGSDDAALTASLNDVSTSIAQENNDQTAATTALNDNQQQITVPTN
jgi:hypothetical protein